LRRRHRYHPTRALALAAALKSICAMGCGPIEYVTISARAGAALAAAKRANGERLAPFEYTAAEASLIKAREEAGYSQYEQSIDFGRRAEALANRARAMAVAAQASGGGQPAPEDLGVVPAALVGKDAPAVVAPAAPAAPAPASRPSRPATDDEQPRKR
jgi:hypothetical protein